MNDLKVQVDRRRKDLVPDELKWLYKEIWIWRGLMILMLLFFGSIELMKWRQLNDHNERSLIFEQKAMIGQDRMLLMIGRNFDAVVRMDEHLRQCSGCHSHPDIKQGMLK